MTRCSLTATGELFHLILGLLGHSVHPTIVRSIARPWKMKKAVVKVNEDDPKSIMTGISKIKGYSFLEIYMNEKILVVISDKDPTDLVNNLRDYVPAAELVRLWPHKETEQKKRNDKGKEAVVKVNVDDPQSKKEFMKGISKIKGHSFLSIDMNKKELVVIGNMDPTDFVYNLRKYVPAAELVTFGPPHKEKEEEKKNDKGPLKENEDKKKNDKETLKEKEEKNKNDEGLLKEKEEKKNEDEKKEAVVKVNVDKPQSKKEFMKGISKIEGHSFLSIDMNKKELVVIGNTDPTNLVYNLRKYVPAELVKFGLHKEIKEKEKNDEGKDKEEKNKKDEGKVDQKPTNQPFNNWTPNYGYNYPYFDTR